MDTVVGMGIVRVVEDLLVIEIVAVGQEDREDMHQEVVVDSVQADKVIVPLVECPRMKRNENE